MESLKPPKSGSGASTPTGKSPTGVANPSKSNISVTVRFNAGDDSVESIYPSFQSNSGKSGGGGANCSSPNSSGSGCDSSTLVAGVDSLACSSFQQQINDEHQNRNNFLQGNFFNRKSGLSPTLQQQQQLIPNHGCVRDGSGSGAHSPSSPIGAAGFSYNGAIPRSPTSYKGCSSGGISPSTSINAIDLTPKYNPNLLEMIGSASGPSNSVGGASGNIISPIGMTKVGGSVQGSSPAKTSNFLNTGSYVRNGLDMRQLDHCLGDIMRNMNTGENSIAAAACQLAERIRGDGKLNDHRLSAVDAVAIAASSGNSGSSGNTFLDAALKLNSPQRSSPLLVAGGAAVDQVARYSRKVFVGGLPPDIDEDEITASFRRFGPLVVDWPHKAESKSYFPPKGYAFLLFQDETSVQNLIDACIIDDEKLYLCVSSPTIKDKPVQIRPWRLNDADYVLDATMSLDPRKTVFVGGVPRPLKAFELAMIMDRLYGGVCYAGIDTDPELKYPKGAGRVAFSNQQSYISAISARFVQLQHADIDKRVEVKPYVLDDQMCDECEGQRCCGKFAPFFCANVTCLQYYCEHCWTVIHSRPGREYHKPLVKEGADRPRAVPFRWC